MWCAENTLLCELREGENKGMGYWWEQKYLVMCEGNCSVFKTIIKEIALSRFSPCPRPHINKYPMTTSEALRKQIFKCTSWDEKKKKKTEKVLLFLFQSWNLPLISSRAPCIQTTAFLALPCSPIITVLLGEACGCAPEGFFSHPVWSAPGPPGPSCIL